MKPKDLVDLLLHCLLGALIAAANLGILAWLATGGVTMRLWITLSLFWSLVVSFTRESEQARAKRTAAVAAGKSPPRPSNVFAWSAHRWGEFLAVPVGALAMMAGYALT